MLFSLVQKVLHPQCLQLSLQGNPHWIKAKLDGKKGQHFCTRMWAAPSENNHFSYLCWSGFNLLIQQASPDCICSQRNFHLPITIIYSLTINICGCLADCYNNNTHGECVQCEFMKGQSLNRSVKCDVPHWRKTPFQVTTLNKSRIDWLSSPVSSCMKILIVE